MERGQHRAAHGRREGVARTRARPRHHRHRRARSFLRALETQPLTERRRRDARIGRRRGGRRHARNVRHAAHGMAPLGQDDPLQRRRRGRRRRSRRHRPPSAPRRRRRRRRGLLLIRTSRRGDESSEPLVRRRQSRGGPKVQSGANRGVATDASHRPRR